MMHACAGAYRLMQVFIGLFAGTQTKLNKERDRHDGPAIPTSTVTATSIPEPSTVITTTTASPPGPTNPPEEVRICVYAT